MRAVVGVSLALVVLAWLATFAVGRRRRDEPLGGLAGPLVGLTFLAAFVLAVVVVVVWQS